ncbi:Phosphoglycerate kinase [uncultured archaeon]|nr:Phosphoglycerate kinase [uncultured archaeon]
MAGRGWIQLAYKSMFDCKLKDKTVFLRVDINSSVVEGRVVISSRIREHAKTIYALSEEGAKVVVLSHQGRPGEEEFIGLKRHADHIKKFIGRPVRFVKWDEDYVSIIKAMKDGEVVLMDNTRFQKEEQEDKTPEEHAKDDFIMKLAPLGQLFVQDALSVCHRPHATVVGFRPSMECVAGPVLKKELDALEKLEKIPKGKLVVLGGAKLSDSVSILRGMLDSGMCNKACIGGLFGELFLKAKGVDFGAKEKLFAEKKFDKMLPDAKRILEKYPSRIILPVDLAVAVQNGNGDSNGAAKFNAACPPKAKRKEIKVQELPCQFITMDIGTETTEIFKKEIRASEVVVFNGPMGVYEQPKFSIGTKKILEAIAFHRCFSIIGGGDTERALTSFGLVPQDFGHVSLAGKALLQYLSAEPLPGLKILEKKK